MTTFHTYDIDSVPAPSDYELEAADAHPRFRPFVAVTRGRLVTICVQLQSGVYVDTKGYFHLPENLTLDLVGYADQQAEDARDQADTFADALR